MPPATGAAIKPAMTTRREREFFEVIGALHWNVLANRRFP